MLSHDVVPDGQLKNRRIERVGVEHIVLAQAPVISHVLREIEGEVITTDDVGKVLLPGIGDGVCCITWEIVSDHVT